MERERLQNYVNNGEKAVPTFSDSEMQRRLDAIRGHMAQAGIDAAPVSYTHLDVYKRQVWLFSSTPWTWKTAFAMSIPIIVRFILFPPLSGYLQGPS